MANVKISDLAAGVTLTATSLFEISQYNGATYTSQKFTVTQIASYLGFSSSLLLPSAGGTGVANNDAATLTRIGSFPLTITLTASTSVTFPTTGTLAATSDLLNFRSTGVVTGGVLSIGTGGAGVATTFTIASGTGEVVNNTVFPFTVTNVTWAAKVDVAITNLLTQTVTYVAIDSSGAVQQSTTEWTPSQLRTYIEIGIVIHANQTTVNAVNQSQGVAYNIGNQFQDLASSLQGFNITGNIFSANGANLKLNKSAGSVFKHGANYSSLTDNPHVVTLASLTQASLRMQNQTGAGSASTTDIDPNNYDLAGVTTAVPANKFSVLRIFSFVSNLVAVQRDQSYYNSLAEAKASIQTDPYIINTVLEQNGILRGYLAVRKGATDLTNISDAAFLQAAKFGGASGVGGLSVSTLQNAYDNSATPEILTDATRGAVSVKRGSGADTDNVIEGVKGDGTVTFGVTGNGLINSATLTASEIAGTDANKNIVSLPVATYPSLTELSYVKGLTSPSQTQINNKQPLDSDLTAIAALSPTNDDFMQYKASAWSNRSISQVYTDLQPSVKDDVYFLVPLLYGGATPLADGSVYYITWGINQPAAGNTDTNNDMCLGFAWTCIGAIVNVGANTTAGTNENVLIKIKNTTSGVTTSIGVFQTNGGSATVTASFTLTGISAAIGVSDSWTIEITNPAWATNPVGCSYRILILGKRS